jgi:Holliday junction resolvase RusA-like endonuclease
MELSIPIKAVGKERPRYSPRCNAFYTPNKTKEFEATIAAHALVHMRRNAIEAIEGPVYVYMMVKVMIPKSWSHKKRMEALAGIIRPTVTPDIDNQLKSVLDGLQGVAFPNDKQVVKCSLEKIYSEEDAIDLKVKAMQATALDAGVI